MWWRIVIAVAAGLMMFTPLRHNVRRPRGVHQLGYVRIVASDEV